MRHTTAARRDSSVDEIADILAEAYLHLRASTRSGGKDCDNTDSTTKDPLLKALDNSCGRRDESKRENYPN